MARETPGTALASGVPAGGAPDADLAARADPKPAAARMARPAKPRARGETLSAAVRHTPVRIGLYPGTFDPVTNGHLDIIARAAKLVDRLVIGVAVNKDKGPLFQLAERVEMVEQECANLQRSGVAQGCDFEVRPFDTLLMRFAEQVEANVIVRGLRAVSDFEYEFQMVGMNQKLNPGVETVFLMADPTHQAIASRLVKEIARLGGDVRQFVPPSVERRLAAKFGFG